MKDERFRGHYMHIPTGHVSKIYLIPSSTYDFQDLPVERIRLQMFAALTTEAARQFYCDRRLKQKAFLALADQGWDLAPRLVFRVGDAPPRFEARVPADARTYFSFWRRNPRWLRGRVSKEYLAGTWASKLVSKGILDPAQCGGVFTLFNAYDHIDVCPGWHLSFSWTMDEAEWLDIRRGDRPRWTSFVTAVAEKIKTACAVMGQDFDDLLKSAIQGAPGVAAPGAPAARAGPNEAI
ncbi:MAG: hypothetical protein LAQ69_40835 [Acidobacteriia bacterium]|nr:hypothetical protein [Terriglobia bacterium]